MWLKIHFQSGFRLIWTQKNPESLKNDGFGLGQKIGQKKKYIKDCCWNIYDAILSGLVPELNSIATSHKDVFIKTW